MTQPAHPTSPGQPAPGANTPGSAAHAPAADGAGVPGADTQGATAQEAAARGATGQDVGGEDVTGEEAAASQEPAARGLLVLIDGHSLAHRAFHALPPDMATTTGQVTNAVFGFTSMLVKLFGDYPPDRIAVCFDVGKPAYRFDLYPEYKANRSAAPDEFRSQLPLIREVLDTLRIPVVEVPGYEADDVIATLVEQATAAGLEVLIVSGDRDTFQLVDDTSGVRVLFNRRGISETVVYDETAVTERYKVPPSRYVDLAALRGDTSDNLPGVPGVGDKTAAKLLTTYGTVEEVLDHADEQRGKLKENLTAHVEGVLRNKALMTLRRDVPLPAEATQLRMGAWDQAAVLQLLDTLEIRDRVRDDLLAAFAQPPPPETGFAVDGRALQPGELAAWLDAVPAGVTVALAAEVHPHPRGGSADLRAVALTARQAPTTDSPDSPAGPPDAVWADLDPSASGQDPVDQGLLDQDLAALGRLLADPERPKVTHDAKPLYLAAWARGWDLAGVTFDTALAGYLLLPAQRTYDLADLSQRYLRKELRAENGDDPGDAEPAQGVLTLDPEGDRARRAAEWCLRAHAVGELATTLEELLATSGMTGLMGQVELPLVPLLAKLEHAGIGVDLSVLAEIGDRLDARLRDHEARVYQLAGTEFNIGSNPQLQEILFDKLGLPKTKRIKTGYTTDATALAALAGTHPIIEELLGYREVAKLKSTYVDALPPMVNPETGRIHAQFDQMIAATGRLSTQKPNVQNIPIRTEAGREIRRAFVAAPGTDGLLVADYAQIEFRVLAHLAGDEVLIAAFQGGEDVHATVAGMVWGLPPDQVDRDLRAKVKMVTYGLAYGLSAYGLAQRLGIPSEEARALMDAYFERFGKVKAYLDGVVAEARKDGYTSTILGRRRYLPDLASDNYQRRQMAERMALNAPIQGSAADLMKLAMLAVDAAMTAEGLASRLVLQVHDELVCEVAPGEGPRLAELVRREMSGVYALQVPLEVAMATGRSWAEAQH